MRATIVILAIVQLLLRGVAVPHCHAHESLSSEAGHSERPHIHVTGHSHSSHHHGHRQSHSHRHAEHAEHAEHDDHAELPVPTNPSPDHDQNALYVGCDVLTARVERLELPAADGNSMIDSDGDRVADSVLPQFVACSKTGPPEGSIFAPLLVLPHMLRL